MKTNAPAQGATGGPESRGSDLPAASGAPKPWPDELADIPPAFRFLCHHCQQPIGKPVFSYRCPCPGATKAREEFAAAIEGLFNGGPP